MSELQHVVMLLDKANASIADLTTKLAAMTQERESMKRNRDEWKRQSELDRAGDSTSMKTGCNHNTYWTTVYGRCMACRAENAEQQLATSEQRVALLQRTIEDHVESYSMLEQRQITTGQQLAASARRISQELDKRHAVVHQLTDANATIARLENELCTAKDQIPPNMDGDSLSVALIKLKDERDQLHATVTAQGEEIKKLQWLVDIASGKEGA